MAANSLREEKEKLVEKEANNNDDAEQPGTSQGHEGGQKGPATLKIHIVRNYRIFEKTIVPAATVAASSSSVA